MHGVSVCQVSVQSCICTRACLFTMVKLKATSTRSVSLHTQAYTQMHMQCGHQSINMLVCGCGSFLIAQTCRQFRTVTESFLSPASPPLFRDIAPSYSACGTIPVREDGMQPTGLLMSTSCVLGEERPLAPQYVPPTSLRQSGGNSRGSLQAIPLHVALRPLAFTLGTRPYCTAVDCTAAQLHDILSRIALQPIATGLLCNSARKGLACCFAARCTAPSPVQPTALQAPCTMTQPIAMQLQSTATLAAHCSPVAFLHWPLHMAILVDVSGHAFSLSWFWSWSWSWSPFVTWVPWSAAISQGSGQQISFQTTYFIDGVFMCLCSCTCTRPLTYQLK